MCSKAGQQERQQHHPLTLSLSPLIGGCLANPTGTGTTIRSQPLSFSSDRIHSKPGDTIIWLISGEREKEGDLSCTASALERKTFLMSRQRERERECDRRHRKKKKKLAHYVAQKPQEEKDRKYLLPKVPLVLAPLPCLGGQWWWWWWWNQEKGVTWKKSRHQIRKNLSRSCL